MYLVTCWIPARLHARSGLVVQPLVRRCQWSNPSCGESRVPLLKISGWCKDLHLIKNKVDYLLSFVLGLFESAHTSDSATVGQGTTSQIL